MNICFHLLQNKTSWKAVIHQLNSDNFARHVLHHGGVNGLALNFSYCEQTATGKILDKSTPIGHFSVR
ncbi:hypothetical protein VV869_15695 [Photobacterium sp. MCCC 1A19761]|uniref:hypothetical protein n=1 Tax=Photobacterium sp. MCCC 1A19761 TaxID=3115000 RepID=UPI00307ECC44